MKKYPFIFLILISFQINAQVSNQVFNKIIDFYNCKITEYSVKSEKTNFSCDENLSYDLLLETIPADFIKSIELCKEIEKIKKLEYSNTLNDAAVINLLFNEVFNDKSKYSILYLFYDSRKNTPPFEEFINSLQKNIQQKLAESQVDEGPSELQGENKKFENDLKSVESKYQTLVTIFILLIIILVFIGVLFFVKNKILNQGNSNKSSEETPDYIKRYIDKQIMFAKFVSRTQFQTFQNKVDDNFKTISNEINEIKNKLSQFENKNSKPSSSHAASIADNVVNEPQQVVFYMPTPQENGSFNADSAQNNFIEGKSIYRFLKTSENKAVFNIENKAASIRLALQYPNDRIDPCCQPLNNFNSNSRSIVTEKKGVAELSNGTWRVITKADIRYEY